MNEKGRKDDYSFGDGGEQYIVQSAGFPQGSKWFLTIMAVHRCLQPSFTNALYPPLNVTHFLPDM